MKKILFVSFLFLLKVSNTYAQSIDSTKNIVEQSLNPIVNKQIFIHQIETFQVQKEETFTKRKNKSKTKRKSKTGIIFLNFAEHTFRHFTC